MYRNYMGNQLFETLKGKEVYCMYFVPTWSPETVTRMKPPGNICSLPGVLSNETRAVNKWSI